jgi:FkbM family methyltransferase
MGKNERDKFLRENRISEFDFLPERTYTMESGVKAIPRRRTRDFQMLFLSREEGVKRHLVMKENEIFVDVGANVGSYSLMVASEHRGRVIRVIAIEAHPGNYKALMRNILCNNFEEIVKPINKVVSNHKGVVSIYERSHDGTRVDSELYSMCNDKYLDTSNILHPGGKSLEVECDTLDNMLDNYKVDVMKIDVEGAEILALEGGSKTMEKLRKIVVEIHGDNLESVKRLLEKNGFEIELTSGLGGVHVIGSK